MGQRSIRIIGTNVTRIIAGVDGSLTLETGGKGKGHIGPNNPDGTLTHATHLEDGEARMDQPDGLQWIKASDGDYLIVDEDSGNDYGERKYVLPIDSETLQLEEEGTGYFLASAGGSLNPRATAEVAAIPGTFTRATSSEFSGSWNVTHLVQTKEDGSFYTQEEIAGTGAEEIIQQYSLEEQTLIGVVQHRGESSGIIEERQADQGGQIFMFNIDIPTEEAEEILGTPEEDSITGTEDDELLRGLSGDDTIFGGAGDDRVVGSSGNDLLEGGTGNDRVTGSTGDDTLIGAGAAFEDGVISFGQGERDILVGNRGFDSTGSDTFILGIASNVFYDDGDSSTRGQGYLARILGFDAADDTIQLTGSSDLYSLEFRSVGDTTDATLIYNGEPGAVGEVIARIIDVNPELSLTDSAFTFV